MEDDDHSRVNRLVTAGADIAGSVTGAGFGMLVAGQAGVLVGAAAGSMLGTLVSMGSEFYQRRLSPRETVRVGALITFASARIRENLDAGREIRDDGFFDDPAIGNRSAGDEIAEEIAQAVQRQAQEKKVRYLGNLLGNLAFETKVDRVTAHRVLRTSEELSFTQFQLLGLYLRDDIALPDGEPVPGEITWHAQSVADELSNLGFAQRELVLASGRGVKVLSSIPSQLGLTSRGRLIADLLGLDALPEEEARDVAIALWERQGVKPPW